MTPCNAPQLMRGSAASGGDHSRERRRAVTGTAAVVGFPSPWLRVTTLRGWPKAPHATDNGEGAVTLLASTRSHAQVLWPTANNRGPLCRALRRPSWLCAKRRIKEARHAQRSVMYFRMEKNGCCRAVVFIVQRTWTTRTARIQKYPLDIRWTRPYGMERHFSR